MRVMRSNGYTVHEREQVKEQVEGKKSTTGAAEETALPPPGGDPFALDPWTAVCSRGDLDPNQQALEGCYDSKITSVSLARREGAWIVNGPTTGSPAHPLPAFSWTSFHEVRRNITNVHTGGEISQSEAINSASQEVVSGSASHVGQPEQFSFSWEFVSPRWGE